LLIIILGIDSKVLLDPCVKYSAMNGINIVVLLTAILGSIGTTGSVFASQEKSPYDSGYEHGCDDA
jgi:hypothetical protein